jgi:hypothetical protein
MGIPVKVYLNHAVPVFQLLMVADAMVLIHDQPETYIERSLQALYYVLGGSPEVFRQYRGSIEEYVATGLADHKAAAMDPKRLARLAMAKVYEEREEIIKRGRRSPLQAYGWLRQKIVPLLEQARRQPVGQDEAAVQFYSTPAVSQRVAIGMHSSNPLVLVKALCAAVDASELIAGPAAQAVEPLTISPAAMETAEAILMDLEGAAYFQDPKLLGDRLQGCLNEDLSSPAAVQIADKLLSEMTADLVLREPTMLAGWLQQHCAEPAP